MTLTLVFLCLLVQRWLKLDNFKRYPQGFAVYFNGMKRVFEDFSNKGVLYFGLLLLPALIFYMIVAMIIYHVVGMMGYFVLSLLVLGYAMDARKLTSEHYQTFGVGSVLIQAFQNIFVYIFWQVVLGSMGVVIYLLLKQFHQAFSQSTHENDKKLVNISERAIEILDWVPLRVLGITYALVGEFTPAFKLWYQHVFSGTANERDCYAEWGCVALGIKPSAMQEPNDEYYPATEGLIDRSLYIWLTVIALFTMGQWVG